MTVAIMQGSRRRAVVQARACVEAAPIAPPAPVVAVVSAPEPVVAPVKRKGRPPGSKNKPKVTD